MSNQRVLLRKSFLGCSFLLICFAVTAQDSIPVTIPISEKNNIQFQELFFEAITQKSIKNHQQAISLLDEANLLIPNNKTVFFELSKNYFLLNKYFEASEYANKALAKDPENLWLLEHLVKIYKHSKKISEAITVQEKIGAKYPSKKEQLVYLHLQNADKKAALNILATLEREKLLNTRLRAIQINLTRKRKKHTAKKIATKAASLEQQFKKDHSYTALKELLLKLEIEDTNKLVTYSQLGMELFPAQPFVYLANGKALNKNKNYKKALESLYNGFDFIIDNHHMQVSFYTEIAKAYQGLGNTNKATEYKNKALKVK